MYYFTYALAVVGIGFLSYWLTGIGLSAILGKRMKVTITNDETGQREVVNIRYKKGDDIHQMIMDIKDKTNK